MMGRFFTEVKTWPIINQVIFSVTNWATFQNFGLIENQSIEENLKLGLIGQKLSRSEQRLRQKQALEQVGLVYLDLDKRIFELSGGESQRVALAKLS